MAGRYLSSEIREIETLSRLAHERSFYNQLHAADIGERCAKPTSPQAPRVHQLEGCLIVL
jgi:hypothetical protein